MSAVQGLDNLHGLGSSFASSGLKRLKKIIETTIESVGVCNVAYDATLKDFVEDGEDGEEVSWGWWGWYIGATGVVFVCV